MCFRISALPEYQHFGRVKVERAYPCVESAIDEEAKGRRPSLINSIGDHRTLTQECGSIRSVLAQTTNLDTNVTTVFVFPLLLNMGLAQHELFL